MSRSYEPPLHVNARSGRRAEGPEHGVPVGPDAVDVALDLVEGDHVDREDAGRPARLGPRTPRQSPRRHLPLTRSGSTSPAYRTRTAMRAPRVQGAGGTDDPFDRAGVGDDQTSARARSAPALRRTPAWAASPKRIGSPAASSLRTVWGFASIAVSAMPDSRAIRASFRPERPYRRSPGGPRGATAPARRRAGERPRPGGRRWPASWIRNGAAAIEGRPR